MNKNKKIIIGILIATFIVIVVVIVVVIAYKVIEKSVTDRENFNYTVENIASNPVNTISNEKDNNKSEVNNTMETITNIDVIINNKKYNAKIENNETVQIFVSRLPLEFKMNELNGNEKYVYIDTSLPINPLNPKHIECGDIMLYGNNCLVVFYKSFDTNYSYTKIGHINNLPNLGSDDIIAKFEK